MAMKMKPRSQRRQEIINELAALNLLIAFIIGIWLRATTKTWIVKSDERSHGLSEAWPDPVLTLSEK
jgi:hypothetical protein